MTAATHYAFSYLVVSASGASPQVALTASLLSLVPDIDHPKSFMGRIFPGLSRKVLKKWGHRKATHSVFAILVVALIFLPLVILPPFFKGSPGPLAPPFLPKGGPGGIYLALVLAYASHIFIDLFNQSGVKLLAPYSKDKYISFRTPAIRILVGTWKEYVLLFIFVLLAFSITGRSFSIHQAVRSASKVFYRHYDGALKDFQDNSRYICNAQVLYFDHVSREKKTETLQVLAMFPEKAFLLRGEERIILKKDNIDEIEIFKTSQKVSQRSLSGSSLEELASIPAGSFVSGTITVKGYVPDIKNSDFVRIEKGMNKLTLVLTCVTPWELREVYTIDRDRQREIEIMRRSLCSYQIARLKEEYASVNRKINRLVKKGFYENYGPIMRLNDEQKKIESRIDTLKMNQATGADEKNLLSIRSMEEGFSVEYLLSVFDI